MWVEVTVHLAGGERVTGKCVKPKGAWGMPISEEDHLVKVRDCMRMVFDSAMVEDCMAAVRRFDALTAAEVRALIHRLGNFSN